MQAMKNTGSRHAIIPKPKGAPMMDVGLILLDPTLNIVAFDRGAAAILNYSHTAGTRPAPASAIPEEILTFIRARRGAERNSSKTIFRIGKNEYHCRTYLMESYDGMSNPMIALHLEKDSSPNDAICDIVSRYHLTDREQEVLRGISMGLATKELADQMEISPNTVKAFLRLVMIKMGVRTRAGIIAKILHNGAAMDTEEPEEVPEPVGLVNRRAV